MNTLNTVNLSQALEPLFHCHFVKNNFKGEVETIVADLFKNLNVQSANYNVDVLKEKEVEKIMSSIKASLAFSESAPFQSVMDCFPLSLARIKIETMAQAYFQDIQVAAVLSEGLPLAQTSSSSLKGSVATGQKRTQFPSIEKKYVQPRCQPPIRLVDPMSTSQIVCAPGLNNQSSSKLYINSTFRNGTYSNFLIGKCPEKKSNRASYEVFDYAITLEGDWPVPVIELHDRSRDSSYSPQNRLLTYDRNYIAVRKMHNYTTFIVQKHCVNQIIGTNQKRKINEIPAHIIQAFKGEKKPSTVQKVLWLCFNDEQKSKLPCAVVCASPSVFVAKSMKPILSDPRFTAFLKTFSNIAIDNSAPKVNLKTVSKELSSPSEKKRKLNSGEAHSIVPSQARPQASLILPQNNQTVNFNVDEELPDEIDIDLNVPFLGEAALVLDDEPFVAFEGEQDFSELSEIDLDLNIGLK